MDSSSANLAMHQLPALLVLIGPTPMEDALLPRYAVLFGVLIVGLNMAGSQMNCAVESRCNRTSPSLRPQENTWVGARSLVLVVPTRAGCPTGKCVHVAENIPGSDLRTSNQAFLSG